MPLVQENALRLLKGLYDQAAGSLAEYIETAIVVQKLGMSHSEAIGAITYLFGKGLARDAQIIADIPWSCLTAAGVDAVEDAMRRPNQPSRFFPPMINILKIDTNYGPIQQGNIGSSQSVNGLSVSPTELPRLSEEIAKLVAALRQEATSANQFNALGKLLEAQDAAKASDAAKAANALGALGPAANWVWQKAQAVGTSVLASALGKHLGL